VVRLGLNNGGGDFSCSSRSGGSGVRVSACPDISDPLRRVTMGLHSPNLNSIQSIADTDALRPFSLHIFCRSPSWPEVSTIDHARYCTNPSAINIALPWRMNVSPCQRFRTPQQCEGGGDEGGKRDAMEHAVRPPPWSYPRSGGIGHSPQYISPSMMGCLYNSVNMLVVFVVRGIRLGADNQTAQL
jgi:hypothetical protein